MKISVVRSPYTRYTYGLKIDDGGHVAEYLLEPKDIVALYNEVKDYAEAILEEQQS